MILFCKSISLIVIASVGIIKQIIPVLYGLRMTSLNAENDDMSISDPKDPEFGVYSTILYLLYWTVGLAILIAYS